MSYILFYGSILVGPFFDYKDYSDFIHLRNNYAHVTGSFMPSLIHLLGGFLCIGIYISLKGPYDASYLATKEYAELSMWKKFTYVNISMFVHRVKYYVAWLLSNASVVVSGLSYQNRGDKDELSKHNQIICVDPIRHELATDLKTKLEVNLFFAYDLNCRLGIAPVKYG